MAQLRLGALQLVATAGLLASLLPACAGSTAQQRGSAPSEARREPARITVRNETPDTLHVELPDGARHTLPAGEERTLRLEGTGRTALRAQNPRTGLSWTKRLDAVAGRTHAWTVDAKHATLRVRNPLDESLDLRLDGRRIGEIPAGEERTFEEAPAGRRTLVVSATRGPWGRQTTKQLEAGGSTSWAPSFPDNLRAPDVPEGKALLVVHNRGKVPIGVQWDGSTTEDVPAGSRVELTLPPGSHELVAQAEGSGIETRRTVEVEAGQMVEWRYGRSEGEDTSR